MGIWLAGGLEQGADFVGTPPGGDEPVLGTLLEALEPAQLGKLTTDPGLLRVR